MDGSTAITRGLNRMLSRRRFIVAGLSAAGGLAVGVAIPGLAKALPLTAEPWSKEGAPPPGEINAWILIEPDDSVVVRFARSEIGQGSFTALPMIVAEELECDWSKVRAEYASANRTVRENDVYRSMSTGGSQAVRQSREYLQQAGASARVRLVEAAARQWGVPASECVARQGKVIHQSSNRSLGYGALAADAARITLDHEPAIKTPDQYQLIGKPMAR